MTSGVNTFQMGDGAELIVEKVVITTLAGMLANPNRSFKMRYSSENDILLAGTRRLESDLSAISVLKVIQDGKLISKSKSDD